MLIQDFIIEAFCFVDDQMKKLTASNPVRQRGFKPALSDSEVIAMELVGEFLGFDTDKGMWEFFSRHWSHFFSRTRQQNRVYAPGFEFVAVQATYP
jgi:hypothetical protein